MRVRPHTRACALATVRVRGRTVALRLGSTLRSLVCDSAAEQPSDSAEEITCARIVRAYACDCACARACVHGMRGVLRPTETHTHTHAHTHTHRVTHTHAHTETHTHTRTHTHTHAHAHRHWHTHARTRTHTHTQPHTHLAVAIRVAAVPLRAAGLLLRAAGLLLRAAGLLKAADIVRRNLGLLLCLRSLRARR